MIYHPLPLPACCTLFLWHFHPHPISFFLLYFVQGGLLVVASVAGDVVRVASQLNSGADIETRIDEVCYIPSIY